MNKFRNLKVYRKFHPRGCQYIAIPEIRLEGKWLEVLGFKIGKEIEIKEQKHKLTIRLIEKRGNNSFKV